VQCRSVRTSRRTDASSRNSTTQSWAGRPERRALPVAPTMPPWGRCVLRGRHDAPVSAVHRPARSAGGRRPIDGQGDRRSAPRRAAPRAGCSTRGLTHGQAQERSVGCGRPPHPPAKRLPNGLCSLDSWVPEWTAPGTSREPDGKACPRAIRPVPAGTVPAGGFGASWCHGHARSGGIAHQVAIDRRATSSEVFARRWSCCSSRPFWPS
jgi:hypothetical protein